jgi:hypothetical protein
MCWSRTNLQAESGRIFVPAKGPYPKYRHYDDISLLNEPTLESAD